MARGLWCQHLSPSVLISTHKGFRFHASLVATCLQASAHWNACARMQEYATGGSLFHYVQKQTRLKEAVARWFFQQLIIGVDYCHKRGVANRDIKLENTLLQKVNGLPLPLLKICDFGYSKADFRSAAKSKVCCCAGAPACGCSLWEHAWTHTRCCHPIPVCSWLTAIMRRCRLRPRLPRPQHAWALVQQRVRRQRAVGSE